MNQLPCFLAFSLPPSSLSPSPAPPPSATPNLPPPLPPLPALTWATATSTAFCYLFSRRYQRDSRKPRSHHVCKPAHLVYKPQLRENSTPYPWLTKQVHDLALPNWPTLPHPFSLDLLMQAF